MKPNILRFFLICTLLAASSLTHAHSEKVAHGHNTHAIGIAGDSTKVTRTVHIAMSDAMRFTPTNIQATQGETIRFLIKNTGKLKHEFVLGAQDELKAHYELMKKFPEMEHSDPNMVAVAPGQMGEVIWRFTKPGKVDFACLLPGHYDAGMKGTIMVSSKPIKPR